VGAVAFDAYAVDLVQLGEELHLDGGDDDGLGDELRGSGEQKGRCGELGRRERSADGAHRHRGLLCGAHQVVGELLAGQAMMMLGQGVQIADRNARRDVEEDVGQPAPPDRAGLACPFGTGRQGLS
jgi:hypothetical protein